MLQIGCRRWHWRWRRLRYQRSKSGLQLLLSLPVQRTLLLLRRLRKGCHWRRGRRIRLRRPILLLLGVERRGCAIAACRAVPATRRRTIAAVHVVQAAVCVQPAALCAAIILRQGTHAGGEACEQGCVACAAVPACFQAPHHSLPCSPTSTHMWATLAVVRPARDAKAAAHALQNGQPHPASQAAVGGGSAGSADGPLRLEAIAVYLPQTLAASGKLCSHSMASRRRAAKSSLLLMPHVPLLMCPPTRPAYPRWRQACSEGMWKQPSSSSRVMVDTKRPCRVQVRMGAR